MILFIRHWLIHTSNKEKFEAQRIHKINYQSKFAFFEHPLRFFQHIPPIFLRRANREQVNEKVKNGNFLNISELQNSRKKCRI